MENKSFEKVAVMFADLMIEKIEKISSNWSKPWISAASKPNFVPQNLSGRKYAGGNILMLFFLCEKQNYQTPVFLTFNQAKEEGISVLKGAKSFPVYYFLFHVTHKLTYHKISFEEYKILNKEEQTNYNVIPIYRYFSVFNLDQTNYSEVKPNDWEVLKAKFQEEQVKVAEDEGIYKNAKLDTMLLDNKWVCPITLKQSDRAFYSLRYDSITIPEKGQFVDGESFYETLLHEMAHSTGHSTRLNRNLQNSFGSKLYGREELVAEFTAALAGMFLGIAERIREENAAYLKSWIKSIKQEPKYLLSVLGDVVKSVKLIADKLNVSLESETDNLENADAA